MFPSLSVPLECELLAGRDCISLLPVSTAQGDGWLVKSFSPRSAEEPTYAEHWLGCPSRAALMISEHLREQGWRRQGCMWMAFDLPITPPFPSQNQSFLLVLVCFRMYISTNYNLSADIASPLLECEFIRAEDCVYSPQNLQSPGLCLAHSKSSRIWSLWCCWKKQQLEAQPEFD